MFGKTNESDSATASDLANPSSIESHRALAQNASTLEPGDKVIAFVGEGVNFKGIISYQGTVRIDGQLEGEIHTDDVLLVGKEAALEAKIEAVTIICQGRITGDIVAREKVQLLSPAGVNRSVKTPSVSMEEGVLFNGTCEMGSPKRGQEARPKEHKEELPTS